MVHQQQRSNLNSHDAFHYSQSLSFACTYKPPRRTKLEMMQGQMVQVDIPHSESKQTTPPPIGIIVLWLFIMHDLITCRNSCHSHLEQIKRWQTKRNLRGLLPSGLCECANSNMEVYESVNINNRYLIQYLKHMLQAIRHRWFSQGKI